MAGPSAMVETNPDPDRSQESGGENPPSSSPAASFISTLGRGLTTECNTTRAPDNFDASLEAACSESEHSISRVLLRAGFQVWFAYFLAVQEGSASGLDQLLPEDLADVTKHIASLDPHKCVKQLFSHLFQGWRGKKRRGERTNDSF